MQQITKVQISFFGKMAIVDSDQVKMLLKKEMLVNESMAARQVGDTETQIRNSAKIISLNRRIRKNVQFVQEA